MKTIKVSHLVSSEFHASEAIKALRTNLIFSGKDVRVIGLTSYGAEEGKSTISFQLAASLAQTGKKVLLLDADLRRSVMTAHLGISGRANGLSHYLSGLENVRELLCPTDLPGLYVLFAGARVPNSSELLGSESFKTLIPALKDAFDYVIVDTAPLGQIIDCAVMSPSLDGVLIVVNAAGNSSRLVRRVKQQLEMSGGKILGVVLNRVDMKERRGSYGKYYGKSYGYGYGYGEK